MDNPAETAENTQDKTRGRTDFLFSMALVNEIAAMVPAANKSKNRTKMTIEFVSVPDIAFIAVGSSIMPIDASNPISRSGAVTLPVKVLTLALESTEKMFVDRVARRRMESSNPQIFRT